MATTGGFEPADLLAQEQRLSLPSLSENDAVALGMTTLGFAQARSLPVFIEVRRVGRVVFRASLNGTSADNEDWARRKAAIVERFGHSTMYERVRHEVQGITFNEKTGLPLSDFAAHGGAFPLTVNGTGVVGVLIVSGLPQVEDHALCVEALETYLAGLSG